MKKNIIIILFWASLSLVFAESAKGIVSYLEGSAQKKDLDESVWQEGVEENSTIKERESYRTMKKSRAELELSDLDIIRLAPKTSIDIVSLYQESANKAQKNNINLNEGEIWAQINSSDEENDFEIDTDISGAVITGTNLRMIKNKDYTQMKVYHGEVKISNSKKKMRSLKPKNVREFNKPKKTFGPKKISGPKKITLKEWVYVVKNMQQITFDRKGNIISAGDFRYGDKSERTGYRTPNGSDYNWVEWNRKMDRKKGLR